MGLSRRRSLKARLEASGVYLIGQLPGEECSNSCPVGHGMALISAGRLTSSLQLGGAKNMAGWDLATDVGVLPTSHPERFRSWRRAAGVAPLAQGVDERRPSGPRNIAYISLAIGRS
jgi:hypothetical protein